MPIKIEPLTDAVRACGLFNAVIAADSLVYKPLNADMFAYKFINDFDGVRKINLTAFDDGGIKAFGNACYRENAETCYITFVAVDPACRRQGLGTAMLKALEDACTAQNPAAKKFDLIFFNPISLEWLIPGTDAHDHPNTPGVDTASAAYPFFQANGYANVAIQHSFHRSLDGFEFTDDIIKKLDGLKQRGITICFHDKNIHGDFTDLCNDLGSDDWRNSITANYIKEKPDPMLIVAKGPQVGGFAGPLRVQQSGRGFFAGIGVHSAFRGGGAGSALFFALCSGLKEMGASFMTLFTGDTNPARNSYLNAGFSIVREWADMRKNIKE